MKAAVLLMGPRGFRVLGAMGLVLSCGTAGAFVVHMASSCPLLANGSLGGFDLTMAFNKNPLLCYDPDVHRFYPCDWGLLHTVATLLAAILNDDTTWVQRAEARRQACTELAAQFWTHTALRRTPPQVRIVPIPISNDPDTVHLICHVWGFYPPAVTIQWLHNGLVVASGDTKLLPNGDWTYRTQVALRASTAAGSTYTCSVWHSSLEQPLQEDWSPNLSPAMMVKVAVAAMALTLGLVALSAGVFSFCQRPRGAFMVHVANSCPLAANGSLRGFDLTVAFNKNPLVCYDPDGHLFNACDWGLLHGVAGQIAIALNNDSTWVQRAEARRRACSKLAAQFWAQTALRRTQPQVRIVPAQTGNPSVPIRLTCHVWGFYPPEVTIIWLHNGDIVGPGDHSPMFAIPNGNWTYQTQVALSVAPEVGDTYTCSVQHASLEEPLLEDWRPGLTLEVTLMVAVATVVMVLGLSLLFIGVYCWRAQPPAPGYAPLPGHNYPSGSI